VAELLGVKVDTLRHWRYPGTGPGFVRHHSRFLGYAPDAVAGWITAHTVAG
jgi:hypothetical protein